MPYTGTSIVDYLKSVGKASDLTSRSALAKQNGISNYTGTVAQNTQLLGILNKPVATAPVSKPAPAVTTKQTTQTTTPATKTPTQTIVTPPKTTTPVPTPTKATSTPKVTPTPSPAPVATAPTPTALTYTVKSGDNIGAIARQYGVNIADISGYRSGNPNLVYPGEVLTIGKGASAPVPTATGGDAPLGSTERTNQLLGDNYFDPATGKQTKTFTPTQTPTTVNDPATRNTEIDRINEEANANQQSDFNVIDGELGNKVEETQSSQIIKALVSSFDKNNTQENKPSLQEEFANQRAKLGVGDKETELAGIDADIAKLDNEFSQLSDTESGRAVSVLQINRRKTAEAAKYEKAREDLVVQRTGVVNELNQKYSTIESIMKYASADYDNAQEQYKTQFSQAINLVNLIKGVEESDKSAEEKKVDNARANLQIVMSNIKGKDYATLDPSTQFDIKNLELQSGFPTGFTKFLSEAVDDPVVSLGSEFTSSNGQRQVPVYTKDPSTGVITAKLITLGSAKPTGTSASNTKAEANDIAAAVLDFKKQMTDRGWKGINPDAYDYYKSAILSEYGAAAVLKFDKAISDAGLSIDDGK